MKYETGFTDTHASTNESVNFPRQNRWNQTCSACYRGTFVLYSCTIAPWMVQTNADEAGNCGRFTVPENISAQGTQIIKSRSSWKVLLLIQ